MRAGGLRAFCALQQRVSETLPDNSQKYRWVKVDDLWADISSVSGRTFIAAGREQASITTEILIRRRTGIKPRMRILHIDTGALYEIAAVLPAPRQDMIRLMCSAVLETEQ